jgi:putative endopeptidase
MKNKTLKIKRERIDIPPFVKSIKPGDDFYRYVNGNWLRSASISSYDTSYGVSEEIEKGIEKDLLKIIKECSTFSEKGVVARTKKEIMMESIGRFSLSCLRPEKQKLSILYLRQYLRSLYCIRDKNDVASYIGIFNKYGIKTLLKIGILQKFTLTGKKVEFIIILNPGSLGLPNLTYYNATAPGKSRTLFSYVKLCKEISKLLDIDDLSVAIPSESYISTYLKKYKEDDYEDIKGSKLASMYPDIPWDILFQNYGIETWKDKEIRVGSMRWIKHIQILFKSWSNRTWSLFFSLHLTLNALPLLPPPYDEYHFELFGKKLRGQAEKLPQDQLSLNLCRQLLTIPLSYLYIEEYCSPTLKKDVEAFAKTIQKHAVQHLKNVDWLDEKTRTYAQQKVNSMNISIAYPEQYSNLTLPKLNSEILLQNVYLLEEMNTKMLIKRLELKMDPAKIWDEAPYTVNAYYYSETNQFIVPAGTLLYPFYKESSKNIGWNYGGLGAIIGHEITHAFDMDGKDIDLKGERKSWWSKKDNTHYYKKTKELIKLFDKGKIYDNHVDGNLTLSENIADLGGLGIALDALKNEIKGYSEQEKKKQLRDFFISFAVSWRVKERPRKAIQSLFMDVHAPAPLRVNYIVSHFQEWYDLFNVVTEDKLYIAPEDRIIIF